MADGAESDVDCGGPACIRCADDQKCNVATDCFSGMCSSSVCAPRPTCADGVRNGTETDIDCGGTTCPRCQNGKNCNAQTDCLSDLCSATRCAPKPSCVDGVRNGDETDTDCGGTVCPRCVEGQSCLAPRDCTTFNCENLVCRQPPTCTDHVRNGNETDVDCGGNLCLPCAVGQACIANTDCATGSCSDKFTQSDTTWKQSMTAPAGWNTAGFDDSAWPLAVSEGAWGTNSVWGSSPALPLGSTATWIWFYDSRPNGGDNATLYFRKTFVAPASPLTLSISVDDNFTAYLNGTQVGSGTLWYNTVSIPLMTTQGQTYVLAVRAQNTGGPGGLVADLRTDTKICSP